MNFEQLLGARIKSQREKQGLSQEQLALVLGYTRTTVTFWEQGKFIPDIKTVFEIAVVLECDFDAFIEGLTVELIPEQRKLLESFNRNYSKINGPKPRKMPLTREERIKRALEKASL